LAATRSSSLAAAPSAAAASRPWFFHRLIAHCQRRASAASVVPPASRNRPSTSSLSRIEKVGLSPMRSPSARSSRTPSEWKVLITSGRAARAPTSAFVRSRISAAALLVKVIAAIWAGSTPLASRRATLCVITRVLPDPAPARTRQGECRWCTASSWRAFKVSVIGRRMISSR
jgi:hypothetical protein